MCSNVSRKQLVCRPLLRVSFQCCVLENSLSLKSALNPVQSSQTTKIASGCKSHPSASQTLSHPNNPLSNDFPRTSVFVTSKNLSENYFSLSRRKFPKKLFLRSYFIWIEGEQEGSCLPYVSPQKQLQTSM